MMFQLTQSFSVRR